MERRSISPRLIASIVHDIDSGRPLWGMLRVNEVVPPYHPLHRILADRAKAHLSRDRPLAHSAETILRGACLHELVETDREAVWAETRGPNHPPQNEYVPRPRRGRMLSRGPRRPVESPRKGLEKRTFLAPPQTLG